MSNNKTKEFALDLLFPKFCVNCQTEGFYLCPDCFSLIEILDRQYCSFCEVPPVVPDGKTCYKCRKTRKLDGLFCATSYENQIVKKLIRSFKYEPFAKDLAETLSYLIVNHFSALGILEKFNYFSDFIIIPIPSYKKKIKYRGFNPAEEIAKKLASLFRIPVLDDVLIKIKHTPPQAELKKEERMENIKGVFEVKNQSVIWENKILLVDDVFTTGATMEEGARVLKNAGALEVLGVVIARG